MSIFDILRNSFYAANQSTTRSGLSSTGSLSKTSVNKTPITTTSISKVSTPGTKTSVLQALTNALQNFAPVQQLAGLKPYTTTSAKEDIEDYLRGKEAYESGKGLTMLSTVSDDFKSIDPSKEYRALGKNIRRDEAFQNIAFGAINETGPLKGKLRSLVGGEKTAAQKLDDLAAEARKYKSAEEFVNGVDRQVVNKQLFGVKTGDVIEVAPNKLSIYADSDLVQAKRNAPSRISEDLSKAPPIKVTITDKGDGVKWYVEDGHNRYIRALNEGKKIKAEITVGDFPVSKSYLTDFYNQATRGAKESSQELLERIRVQSTADDFSKDGVLTTARRLGLEKEYQAAIRSEIGRVTREAGGFKLPGGANNLDTIGSSPAQTGRKLSQSVDSAIPETGLGGRKIAPQILEDAGQSAVREVAYKNTTVPPTLQKTQAGVLGLESKALPEQSGKAKEIISKKLPIEGRQPTGASAYPILDSRTLPKTVAQNHRLSKAIEKTAKQVKDSPSVVRRIIDSAKRIKTSVIEYVQNSEERVRQLVSRKNVKVDDISDPYLKATLYPGRVANKVAAGKEEARALLSDMKKVADEIKSSVAKIRKEVNDYLRFRHAPERNLALGDGAAGITTKEAQAGLRALEESPHAAKIKELADRASKLNEQTLDLLKESGVISDELYTTLRTKYKNHVPLQRVFGETEDIGSVLSGKGFDVRSTGIKRAVGSDREVDDILTNIVTNYEQAVLRSEKNIVDMATLEFVRKNEKELGGLFEIQHPQAVGKTFDDKVILEQTQDPSILQMFEKGKRVWIKINDPHLAIALRGVGREKLGILLNTIGKFTRLYSGLATRFNPEFALPNKIRDLQETMVYLSAQKEVGFSGAARTALKDPVSIKAVTDGLRGVDSEGARLYAEMQSLGGTTGGFGLSTKKQVEINMDKLESLVNSKTKRIANNLMEYVDNWNTIFEDSTRLSVYRQALTSGLSKERAAFLAKEASINFNRMGRGGPVINALWMFSNASIQGSTKMIRSLKNPKVLGAVVVTMGASVAAVNEWNDSVDPEWRNKVSKWDRLNGLPIVLPSEEGVKYITIPISWGLKPIKVLTEYAYDAMDGRGFDAGDAANDTLVAMMEAYNPVGGTDLVSSLAPTFLDVPVEIARNQSWSGSKIRPDFDPNAPADVQYFDSLGETKTGQIAISISEALAENVGISISPADIKYAYDAYVGGAGRAVSKTANLISGGVTGDFPPPDEYPIISRFYRERTAEEVGAGAGGDSQEIKDILETQSRGRFTIKKEAELLDKELQALPRDEANARALKAKEENPEVYEKLKDVVEERKLGLTYTEKLMKQLGVENGERAKYIHEQILKLPKEKRQAYYQELKAKKIISKEVAQQLAKLQNQER